MNNLPLYHFFKDLQKDNNFYIGIDDYNLFLEILMNEIAEEELHYLSSKMKLFNLCKLLWFKPKQNEKTFEMSFEKAWSINIEIKSKISNEEYQGQSEITEEESKTIEEETDEQKTNELKIPENEVEESFEEEINLDNNDIEIYLNFAENTGNSLKHNKEDLNTYFHFVANYVPYPKRDISQTWRSLQKEQIVSNTDKIDIQKTIDNFCQNGVLDTIFYEPKIKNEVSLITLIDINEEMIAFKHLAQAIAKNANENAAINNQVFYFKNYPKKITIEQQTGYCLYQNEQQTEYQLLQDILNKKDIAVLVISDMNAATNYLDIKRLENIELFLNRVRKQTHKIAWLNPMPKDRWKNTSAAILQKLVPMYEANLDGLRKAIQILRGKKQWVEA